MDFEEFLLRVGEHIRRARWAAGMTQEEVAAANLSYRYFQEVERGERNPSLATLHTIAGVLDVPVAVLVETDPTATATARAKLSQAPLKPPRRGRRPKPPSRR